MTYLSLHNERPAIELRILQSIRLGRENSRFEARRNAEEKFGLIFTNERAIVMSAGTLSGKCETRNKASRLAGAAEKRTRRLRHEEFLSLTVSRRGER